MSSNLVNKLWWVLVFISGGIALWFAIEALIGMWNYHKLDRQTPAQIEIFTVVEKSSSKYLVNAKYIYQVDNLYLRGETLFVEPVYLNRISAEEDLKKWKEFKWEVWYNSNRPIESSLQKVFPFRTCLYALLTLGVFIYFLVLRYFTFSRSMWKNDM